MRKMLAALILVTACTEIPQLDQDISDESLAAPYPKLIALEGQTVLETGTSTQDVIDELDGRTASLWSKIGSIFN